MYNHRLCQGCLQPAVEDGLCEDKGDEYNNVPPAPPFASGVDIGSCSCWVQLSVNLLFPFFFSAVFVAGVSWFVALFKFESLFPPPALLVVAQ